MIWWRDGYIREQLRGWSGAQEYRVELSDGTLLKALAYTELVGTPSVGTKVLLNATALGMGLGTGGYALIVATPEALPADPTPQPGHMVKARYTPLQTVLMGIDEQDSPHHDVLADAQSLDGMPVVATDLHSALPAIIAGARSIRADARIVYVMADQAALPAAFSMNVAALREAKWMIACITAGQAFGGDAEAVTIHSALLAARHVYRADLAIVIQGPGNLGTGTAWGFSGITVGEYLNATAALEGTPIAALRVSASDARGRHQGISHHSTTALAKVALAPCDVVLPELAALDATDLRLPEGTWAALDTMMNQQAAVLWHRHRQVSPSIEGLVAALATSPVRLSSMGRSFEQDPSGFIVAAGAGKYAASLL